MTKRERRRERKKERQLKLVSDNPEPQRREPRKYKKVRIEPRTAKQRRLLAALRHPDKHIVFATGPAGTGKTLLATLHAIQQLQDKTISKIVITRPAVSVDEQHGFLPGDLNEKMGPWTRPIFDIFEEYFSTEYIDELIRKNVIEIAPLAYMRGRTFKNAMIIADEMQNATPSQMKMLLTRIGENSSLVVTGDLDQHDRGFADNGLGDFIHRLADQGSRMIGAIGFTADDVQRHPVVAEVLRLYDECA